MPFERVHQAKAKGAQLTPAERGLVKGRVLVAEDNQTNAQLVAEMLDIAGCERTIVHNGRAALAKLADGEFDLVLMDWHMPELDGVEATKAWRTVESTRNNGKRVPIIALTASVLPGDREACLAAGMDDFIPKPVSYEDLVTKLRAWLPAHSAERAAALAQ
jgi:CheY-like chemotaxis protein